MSSTANEARIYVTRTPGVCGGKACIAGTRISVELIVLRTEAGDSQDEIVRAYPHLSLAEVHGALAYYFDHVDEINADIVRGRKLVEQMRAKTGPGPLETLLLKESADAHIPS